MTIVITNNDNGKYRSMHRRKEGRSERKKVKVKGREEM